MTSFLKLPVHSLTMSVARQFYAYELQFAAQYAGQRGRPRAAATLASRKIFPIYGSRPGSRREQVLNFIKARNRNHQPIDI